MVTGQPPRQHVESEEDTRGGSNSPSTCFVHLPGIIRRTTPHRIVAVVLGLVLLVAAGLKTLDLWGDSPHGGSIFAPRWFQIALIEVEFALGLWLLSGYRPALSRWAAMGCFAAFASFSGYQAFSGLASCGCLGGVKVSSWHTLAFDLAALGCLTLWPPKAPAQPAFTDRDHGLRWITYNRRS